MPEEEKFITPSGAEVTQAGELVQAPEAITSADLEPTTPVNFQTPEQQPIFPVAGLNAQLTQPEQQAQGITEELQGLTAGLLGESETRATAEEEAGIAGLTQQESDLATRLSAIQREAQAIPLQLQQEATGRGITAGGLRPLQTARLRENAIQALTTASQLEAVRGRLTTALDLVDRAVAQKYDPIKEEIAVKQANLQLILQSPAFTAAQKRQAEQQAAQQEARKLAIEKREEDEKSFKEFTAKIAGMGVSTEILERANSAGSYEEAFSIAMPEIARLAREDKKAEQALKDLQVDNIRSQIEARRNDQILKAVSLADNKKKIEEKELAANEEAKEKTKVEAESAIALQTLIGDLVNHPKLEWATGFTSVFPTLPGFKTRDFNLTHQQLKDSLTRDNLDALRGLGAMSERELALIEKSATKLDLGLPEDEYVAELQKIEENLKGTFDKALELGVLSPLDLAAAKGLDASDLADLESIGIFDTAGGTAAFNPGNFYK